MESIADVPELTDYLHEGESTWVRLRLLRLLVARPDEPLFVWCRWTELTPPVVRHTRIRTGTARETELRAVVEFQASVGALSRYPTCRVVTLGHRVGDTVHAWLGATAGAMPDTVDAGDLARMLFMSE